MVYKPLYIVIIFLVKEVISTKKYGNGCGFDDFINAGGIGGDVLLESALIAFLN